MATIRFKLKSQSSGKVVDAVEITSTIPTAHLGSTRREDLDGLSEFRLANGTALSLDEDGVFTNIKTGEKFRRL